MEHDFWIVDSSGMLYFGGGFIRFPLPVETSATPAAFLRSLTVVGLFQIQYPGEGSGENA